MLVVGVLLWICREQEGLTDHCIYAEAQWSDKQNVPAARCRDLNVKAC